MDDKQQLLVVRAKVKLLIKKMQAEAKAFSGNYIRKNDIRILDLIRKIDDEKFNTHS